LLIDTIATPGIIDFLRTIDANQGGDITQLCNSINRLVVVKHAIRDYLEVAFGMVFDDLKERRVDHRLTAEQSVEKRLVPFSSFDDPFNLLARKLTWFLGSMNPATLALQVTGVGDGQEEEGREELA